MSLTKQKDFLAGGARFTADGYKHWGADVLGRIYGWGANALRAAASAADANIASARNWYAKDCGISGRYLLNLMASDDRFFAEVCRSIGRDDLADHIEARHALADVRDSLERAQALLARHE